MEDVKNSPRDLVKFPYSKLLPLLLVCVITLLFYPSIKLLYVRWIQWDEGLSHGLMIIGLFLFFIAKSSPWPITQQSTWVSIFCLVSLTAISIFWFLAHITNIFILEQLALIPAFMLLIAAGYGWKTSYQQKMLLVMPIFAIPIWDMLNDPLVNLSSFIVGKLVRLIDMTAVIDGNSIFIPFGHILIADGCSGIRYFVIALALGYIISYLNNYRFTKLVITLAIAAALGLIANWVRIFLLVIIGYETEMQSSLMNDHEYFGWFIFALMGFPAIYFAPVVKTNISAPTTHSPHRIGIWLIAILALSVGPVLNLALNPAPRVNTLSDILDQSFTPIVETNMPMAITSPAASRQENAVNGSIYFQIDQYQRQATTDKLVPYINRLYSKELWSSTYQERINSAGLSAQLTQFRHKSNGKAVLQLQWFNLANTTTHSLAIAKLLQIPAQVRGQNHFMIISLQTICAANNCENAKRELIEAAISLANRTQGD
jgi:exosortase